MTKHKGYIMKNVIVIPFIVILLFAGTQAYSFDELEGIFSTIETSTVTGEISGIELYIVNTRKGYFVFVISAEANVSKPILSKLEVTGNKISFGYMNEYNYVSKFNGIVKNYVNNYRNNHQSKLRI